MVAAVPTFRDGVMATAADLNALSANINNLYSLAMGGTGGIYVTKKPQLILRVTATRSCPRNVDTLVTWDAADVNNDSMWSAATPTTITINTAGTYRLTSQVGIAGTFGDGMSLYIVANGTVTSTNTVGCWKEDHSTQARASVLMSFLPGATLGVIINHTASTSRNFLTNSGGCRFEAIRVGPA